MTVNHDVVGSSPTGGAMFIVVLFCVYIWYNLLFVVNMVYNLLITMFLGQYIYLIALLY